ncbi:probable inactive leucine-rich repeat receptor kinase XIAO [Gossypium hirsutum]|uniref:Probable inactive leucine-rich repeat receptor kinase XIAO n=1 Tax=Gossypium hirsutum TaxID=3635 RepID=A0A1U8ISZ5_GOSHI|nr:probable inactive leucine-rich repeat receptor kinase XIAO [Gossypium hirsutum]
MSYRLSTELEGLQTLEELDFMASKGVFHNETTSLLQVVEACSPAKTLFLNNNYLTKITSSQGVCGLRKLEELDLSGNALDGSIPSCFRNLTSLDLLDISSNRIENNTRLQQFLMQGNSFKGPLQLPKHVNVNMFQVDMSGNKMQGQIPMNIGSMFPHLQILNLSRNVFEGNVPPCLGGLKSLSSLDLSYNNFSGGILEELVKSGSLLTLRLSSNNFEWGNTTYNILSDNHLSGELPKWIWNVPNLEALDFSNNNFYGHIPLEFCNLGLLRFLDLSQNNLSDLGQNNLTRKIPYWIANLSALRILVLRGNHFEGEIPSQICQLNLLSIVDLSQNKLSGHIPSCLSTLTLMPTDKSFRTASTPYLIDASQDLSLYFQVQVIDIPVAMWRNKSNSTRTRKLE